MVKHDRSGHCARCEEIFNRYPGFNPELKGWFFAFQAKHPEAHISDAGRGSIDQEAAFIRKASRAHFGQSSHNWNMAIDIFELGGDDVANIYEPKWFNEVLAPEIPPWLNWYGAPGAPFHELPHVEVRDWKKIKIKLVEGK